VEHGTQQELYEETGISANAIKEMCERYLSVRVVE
jgi:hypothetical protein